MALFHNGHCHLQGGRSGSAGWRSEQTAPGPLERAHLEKQGRDPVLPPLPATIWPHLTWPAVPRSPVELACSPGVKWQLREAPWGAGSRGALSPGGMGAGPLAAMP